MRKGPAPAGPFVVHGSAQRPTGPPSAGPPGPAIRPGDPVHNMVAGRITPYCRSSSSLDPSGVGLADPSVDQRDPSELGVRALKDRVWGVTWARTPAPAENHAKI